QYLKKFPIDSLKIDRSFVSELPHDPDDVAIVLGIISMAAQLQLNVVAEGVETTNQLEFLRRHNCQMMQGFLFSPPVPAEELADLLPQKLPLKS
ncbi:MAG: EAL domain-containing protein, partial [Desulfarculaceae bacterium]